MNHSLAIPRDSSSAPLSQQFAALLQEGIALCQQYGGALWTDYNEHDPGLTILEQLCYALTDCGYRLSYSIEEILAEQPQAAQAGQTSLFTGDRVLSCEPLTERDYRKQLYDDLHLLPGFSNVWLRQVDGWPGLLEIDVEVADHLPPAQRDAILDAAASAYHQHRNLGETMAGVQIMPVFAVELELHITLVPGADTEQVLAAILFAAQNHLVPFITLQQVDQLMADGVSPDQIYLGPTLRCGVIPDAFLLPPRRSISAPVLKDLLRDVAGVASISRLCFQDGLSVLQVPIGQVPRLHDSVPLLRDIAVTGGSGGAPRTDRVATLYTELLSRQRTAADYSQRNQRRARYAQLPSASARAIGVYASIQEQFPAIYGIGSGGVVQQQSVAQAPEPHGQRRAQLRQLKAYLLFFEQLLANQLAQQAHAATLFSLDPGLERSYFWQSLLAPGGPAQLLELDLLSAPAPSAQPPGVTEYRLYLNADDAAGELLLRSPVLGAPEATRRAAQQWLQRGQLPAAVQIHHLAGQHYQLLLKDEQQQVIGFGAQRYADLPTAQAGVAELHRFIGRLALDPELRARSLLVRLDGKTEMQPADICCPPAAPPGPAPRAYYEQQLDALVRRFDPFFARRNQVLDHLLARFGEQFDDERLRAADPRRDDTPALFERDLLHWKLSLLRHYVVTPVPGAGETPDFYNRYAIGACKARAAAPDADPTAPLRGAGLEQRLRCLLGILGAAPQATAPDATGASGTSEPADAGQPGTLYDGEDLWLIEHIQLLPVQPEARAAQCADFHVNRLSLLFPANVIRFRSQAFRTFAEELVVQNCPAHLRADCYWLEQEPLQHFRVLHQAWSAVPSAVSGHHQTTPALREWLQAYAARQEAA